VRWGFSPACPEPCPEFIEGLPKERVSEVEGERKSIKSEKEIN